MSVYAFVERVYPGFGIVRDVIDMGSHVPEIAPPSYWIDITGYTPAPVAGEAWFYNISGDVFTQTDPRPAATEKFITPEEFWFTRFTDDERGKVWALSQEDGGGVTLTIIQRGRLKALLAFTVGNDVDLMNTEVIYIVNALETNGALASGRAAEILG